MRHKVDRRVLASSIDLDIKFHAVTFVEAGKARTFDRTDMHEGIGLTVITSDETKALHRIEELDGPGGLVTGKLTLRRSHLALGDGNHITHDHEIACGNLAASIYELELELLAFSQTFKASAFHRADVHEHIFSALIPLDEAEALGRVEKLDGSFALADDLGRHAAATWAATAKTAATARTAAEAASTRRTAEATAAIIAAAAEPVLATETILPGEERIELVLSKPIPLVASPSATPSVKTHLYERTFCAPKAFVRHVDEAAPDARASSRTNARSLLQPRPLHQSETNSEQKYVPF